ncbi:hypothetical protein ABZU86_13460 [Streptomyces sp. NPDC005271]|uniref:hypothetical protein n=1 Tax=unclassified Streptomyces TaxID=2593676 RepID=UPI0033A24A60
MEHEDEYAIDPGHQAVELARTQVLAMIKDRAGPFADADWWAAWRWNATWLPPRPASALSLFQPHAEPDRGAA